jgi:hypothetical protein
MTRTIPILAREYLEQESSPQAFLIFVEITHPEIEDVFNLVVDGADYIWDNTVGGTDPTKDWMASYFTLELLTDTESPPEAKFSFPNVNREAISKLADVSTPARVSFYVVPTSYFDLTVDPRTVLPGFTVATVYAASALFLIGITANQISVDGTLRGWDYRQEQWPDKRSTKALTPGVYAR